jgi:transcriptional regulator with XRE-family HTH domain
MRARRKFTQRELASLSGTDQSAISRVEQATYDGWTFKTLVSVADALNARLRVTLEPMEDVASASEEE